MAFPMGGHPTVRDYMQWAHSQGCKFVSGFSRTKDVCHQKTKIIAPSGKWVVLVDIQPTDRLEPSKVSYYDRRLGLKSPFPGLPAA